MPLSYTIDRTHRLVRIVGSGPVTDDDVVTCMGALYSDPELEPDMNTLSDMRGVKVAFTAKGVSALRQFVLGSARRGVKIATVVDSTAGFGMGRMTQTRLQETGVQYRVFHDADEAARWVGMTDPAGRARSDRV